MNAPLAKEQIALLMTNHSTYRMPLPDATDTGATRQAGPAGIFGMIALALKTLIDLPRRRAVLSDLHALSDRELSDIGLVRTDLHRVFDPSFTPRRG